MGGDERGVEEFGFGAIDEDEFGAIGGTTAAGEGEGEGEENGRESRGEARHGGEIAQKGDGIQGDRALGSDFLWWWRWLLGLVEFEVDLNFEEIALAEARGEGVDLLDFASGIEDGLVHEGVA